MRENIVHKLETVSPHSGNYERNKEKNRISRDSNQSSGVAFGLEELAVAILKRKNLGNTNFENFTMEDLNDPDILNFPEVLQVLKNLKQKLIEKADDKVSLGLVKMFLLELAEDLELKVIIRTASSSEVVDFLKSMDDRTFLHALFIHISVLERNINNFKEYEQIFRKDFLKVVDSLIKEGVINLDIAWVKNRIDTFPVVLEDYLLTNISKRGEVYSVTKGLTNNTSDYVVLSLSLADREEARHAYNHELVHVLAGRSPVLIDALSEEIDPVSGLVKKDGEVSYSRNGLYFRGENTDWLNEAITEDLARIISERQHNLQADFYAQERELLELILTKGSFLIDKKVFYSAYFSNLKEVGVDSLSITPQLEYLLGVVDQAYGIEGFSTAINDFIAEHGIEKTIKVFKEDPNLIK